MDEDLRQLESGEAITIEGTFPGVFIEHLPRDEYDPVGCSVVMCVLPSKMFDPVTYDVPTMAHKDWVEMVAYLWKKMGVA